MSVKAGQSHPTTLVPDQVGTTGAHPPSCDAVGLRAPAAEDAATLEVQGPTGSRQGAAANLVDVGSGCVVEQCGVRSAEGYVCTRDVSRVRRLVSDQPLDQFLVQGAGGLG